MRIALATRSLALGGVPMQLSNLARGLVRRGHQVSVVVLYPNGVLQSGLERSGVAVHCLNKAGRWDMLGPTGRYLAIARRERFDAVYSFLPVENLMSLVVARRAGAALIWGLRGATQDLGQHGYASRLLWGLQRRLMWAPSAVISNSRAALIELGIMPGRRFVVVPNGIDTDRFQPYPQARAAIRAELGLPHDAAVVGCVSRLDTVKDHPTLLRAVALIANRRPDVRFVVVGGGSAQYRDSLQSLAIELGIGSNLRWLGERQDVERVLNAFDVYASASTAEGFSNALAEAMACGISPVVTDAGDSSDIVGAHGTVIAFKDPEKLAAGVLASLESDTADRRAERRNWIVRNFGVEQMIDASLDVLRSVLAR